MEQVELLQLACIVFDAGKTGAAKHLAVGLRTMLHNTEKSRSLLDQLGLRQCRFVDCSLPQSGRMHQENEITYEAPSCRLVVAHVGPGGGEFLPLLSGSGISPSKRAFVDWWNDPVTIDNKGRTFNRRELIINVAETDGGAHVDPGLEEKYLEFSRRNSLSAFFSENGRAWRAIPAPHLPAMRQIAHEVLLTLEEKAAWSFKEKYKYSDPSNGRQGIMVSGVSVTLRPNR